jgi:hypothetical protein
MSRVSAPPGARWQCPAPQPSLNRFDGLCSAPGRTSRPGRMQDPASPMTKSQIASEIKKIVKNQLDDCERAIKAGTKSIALYELEDAARRLKQLASLLETKIA